MALQGNLAIWNYSKLISKFPEIETYKKDRTFIFKNIVGSNVQVNPFKNNELILLSYDGDNLNYSTGYYPDYDLDTWLRDFDLTIQEHIKAEEILFFLQSECLIADWNIWN